MPPHLEEVRGGLCAKAVVRGGGREGFGVGDGACVKVSGAPHMPNPAQRGSLRSSLHLGVDNPGVQKAGDSFPWPTRH